MKSWNSLIDLLNEIDGVCNYVILRNYEKYFFNECIPEHEDIDILCDNAVEVIDSVGAERIGAKDNVHVYIKIGCKKIRMDIRSVGDGYYDEKWEKNMLINRKLYKESFYVLDDIDYYYSIIYHEVFHKCEWRADYEELLRKVAINIGKKFEIENVKKDLEKFMHINNYIETGYRSMR